jgi:hydrogenase-4 membrane subunit HyfE
VHCKSHHWPVAWNQVFIGLFCVEKMKHKLDIIFGKLLKEQNENLGCRRKQAARASYPPLPTNLS